MSARKNRSVLTQSHAEIVCATASCADVVDAGATCSSHAATARCTAVVLKRSHGRRQTPSAQVAVVVMRTRHELGHTRLV